MPDVLASWLTEMPDEPRPVYLDRLWHILQSPRFAALWYGAREAGEALRALALEDLYMQRPMPGGAHPDPREPSAFSPRAVIAKVAALLSVKIWQVPADVATGRRSRTIHNRRRHLQTRLSAHVPLSQTTAPLR